MECMRCSLSVAMFKAYGVAVRFTQCGPYAELDLTRRDDASMPDTAKYIKSGQKIGGRDGERLGLRDLGVAIEL